MVVVVIFAVLFACALMILVALFGKNPAVARAERARRELPITRERMTATRLRGLVVELLDAMGISLADYPPASPEGAVSQRFVAVRKDPFRDLRYFVFLEAAPPGDVVDQTVVLELAEQLKYESGALGLLVTPYTIERTGISGVDESIHLIDGARLRQLVAEHLPHRLPELDRYVIAGEAPRATPDSLELAPTTLRSGPRPNAVGPRPASART